MSEMELSRLRTEIDRIDEELVELLSRRFRVTSAVGELKARSNLQAVDNEREARQLQRLRELALRHSVNPQLIAAIFRSIVTEVVLSHKEIARLHIGSDGLSPSSEE